MFHLFHKKNLKNETALIFSIESGEVVSALVRFRDDEKPNIIYTKRSVFSYREHNDVGHLTPAMLYTLKRAAEDVVNNGFIVYSKHKPKISIKNTYVFLGSPWYKSATVSKTISKDGPFILTESVLEKSAEEFFESLEVQGVHLEKKIISIKANGYTIDNPIGRKVNSVDLRAFVAAADEKLIEEIKNTLYLSFPNYEIKFHTILMAASTLAVNTFSTRNFILMIPEHEVSEFALISNGALEASVSVPFGRHRIIEYIAKEHESSKVEASSLLKLWKEGKLEASKAATIETIIEHAKGQWAQYFKAALTALGKSALLPSSILILGHSVESEILSSWIKEEEYANQTFTIEKFKVAFFSRKMLEEHFVIEDNEMAPAASMESVILFLRKL